MDFKKKTVANKPRVIASTLGCVAISFVLLFLAACSNASSSVDAAEPSEPKAQQNGEVRYDLAAAMDIEMVASPDELEKCGSANESALTYVKSDSDYYMCYNGEWRKGSSSIAMECSAKNEGDTLIVPRDRIYDTYVCENGSWISDFGGAEFPSGVNLDSLVNAITIRFISNYEPVKGVPGTMVDKRDGKKYKTTTILYEPIILGRIKRFYSMTWMAENLNYKMGESSCYDDSVENCEKYGRLYNWYNAMKACPEGWHLPTPSDYKTLVALAAGDEDNIQALIARAWKGTDKYGFSAIPAGKYDWYQESSDFWWSSPYMDLGNAFYMWLLDEKIDQSTLNAGRFKVDASFDCLHDHEVLLNGLSVRCVKEWSPQDLQR